MNIHVYYVYIDLHFFLSVFVSANVLYYFLNGMYMGLQF